MNLNIKPLLVFDFDGVIIDGIDEYWNSSRQAFFKMIEGGGSQIELPHKVPQAFRYLRPWIQHGWEMVVLAAEFSRDNGFLSESEIEEFSTNFHKKRDESLNQWGWEPVQLQKALDNVRREAIAINFEHWLSHHKVFPGVASRLNQLQEEIDLVVLTTKSAEFTSLLLNYFNIQPNILFGHEAGDKRTMLLQLYKTHEIKGFVEDRRATLEKVLKTPGLSSIPCYLASWGYLKPNDFKNLPEGIYPLEKRTFEQPLANWN